MYEKPLIPQEAIARGRPLGRVPFGFGPRFFVALVLGLVWLVPAWWFSRFIYAMLLCISAQIFTLLGVPMVGAGILRC